MEARRRVSSAQLEFCFEDRWPGSERVSACKSIFDPLVACTSDLPAGEAPDSEGSTLTSIMILHVCPHAGFEDPSVAALAEDEEDSKIRSVMSLLREGQGVGRGKGGEEKEEVGKPGPAKKSKVLIEEL